MIQKIYCYSRSYKRIFYYSSFQCARVKASSREVCILPLGNHVRNVVQVPRQVYKHQRLMPLWLGGESVLCNACFSNHICVLTLLFLIFICCVTYRAQKKLKGCVLITCFFHIHTQSLLTFLYILGVFEMPVRIDLNYPCFFKLIPFLFYLDSFETSFFISNLCFLKIPVIFSLLFLNKSSVCLLGCGSTVEQSIQHP